MAWKYGCCSTQATHPGIQVGAKSNTPASQVLFASSPTGGMGCTSSSIQDLSHRNANRGRPKRKRGKAQLSATPPPSPSALPLLCSPSPREARMQLALPERRSSPNCPLLHCTAAPTLSRLVLVLAGSGSGLVFLSLTHSTLSLCCVWSPPLLPLTHPLSSFLFPNLFYLPLL